MRRAEPPLMRDGTLRRLKAMFAGGSVQYSEAPLDVRLQKQSWGLFDKKKKKKGCDSQDTICYDAFKPLSDPAAINRCL